MARSLVVPGWGQAALGRKVTGAVFVFWEGVTFAMTIKSAHQASYMRRVGHEALEAKEQEFEDWLILLIFNHLSSAAEAYVAANLWDFPEEIRAQRLPNGQLGVSVRVPLRRP